MARRFSSWNVRVTNTSSSVSGTDLVQQLVTRVSDETIARFFQSPSVWDKLDFKQCALALGALAGSSTRGSALTYTNELRNKQKWSKLVELLAERTLTLKHPRHKSIMESNNHFISTCNSLAKLRYAQAPERLVRKLPHDPAYCFPHLLRYVAEVNGSVDLVLQDAEQFAERLASVKQLSWLPAHLASSLSMLLCDNPARLNQLPALEKIHHWVWKQQPSTTSTSDLLDLFENYLVFKPQVSSDLFTKLQSTYETHPRQREVHSSRFQSQVAQALQVLDLAYQHEAMDGQLDFLVTAQGKKLGLQCYGPTHFVFDGSKLEGRTKFRQHLFQPLPVVHVDFAKWEYLTSAQDRREYLQRVITN